MNDLKEKKKSSIVCTGIRTLILTQGVLFLFSSIMWAISDDLDKSFMRWALGMILLAGWGIMKHLSYKTGLLE